MVASNGRSALNRLGALGSEWAIGERWCPGTVRDGLLEIEDGKNQRYAPVSLPGPFVQRYVGEAFLQPKRVSCSNGESGFGFYEMTSHDCGCKFASYSIVEMPYFSDGNKFKRGKSERAVVYETLESLNRHSVQPSSNL